MHELKDHQKIVFRLERDEGGYPPSDYEGLWAVPLPSGNYLVDNISFFVAGISNGDEVSVRSDEGELFFMRLVSPSAASTFRIIPADLSNSEKIRDAVKALGCLSEYNQGVGVIAVEVPADTPIQPFLDYIVEGREADVLDFEEGALRHELAGC